MRFSWLAILTAVSAIAACSTFSEADPVGSDAGDGGGTREDAALDAATDVEEGLPPDGGDPRAGCVTFGKDSPPLGWSEDRSGLGTLIASTVSGQPCTEATVSADGAHAAFKRTFEVPSSGTFAIDVALTLNALPTTVMGWRADVVTVSCDGASALAFAVVPAANAVTPGSLIAEVPGATPYTQVELGNADGLLQTLTLTFNGAGVGVAYGTAPAGMLSKQPSIAPGVQCTLSVGAVASGPIPAVRADLVSACVR